MDTYEVYSYVTHVVKYCFLNANMIVCEKRVALITQNPQSDLQQNIYIQLIKTKSQRQWQETITKPTWLLLTHKSWIANRQYKKLFDIIFTFFFFFQLYLHNRSYWQHTKTCEDEVYMDFAKCFLCICLDKVEIKLLLSKASYATG